MCLRFRNVKSWSLSALYFAHLSVHTDITFPQPHTSELSSLLNYCPPRLRGLWAWKLAEGQRSPSGPTLPGSLQVSLHSAFSKGKNFFGSFHKGWHQFALKQISGSIFVSNFSALIPPSVHFNGLTHSENSAKCLIYWLYPFLLPRILINSFLCTYIFFFCHFDEIWGWREAKLICFTCHLKAQVNTFKFYFQPKMSIDILDFF